MSGSKRGRSKGTGYGQEPVCNSDEGRQYRGVDLHDGLEASSNVPVERGVAVTASQKLLYPDSSIRLEDK